MGWKFILLWVLYQVVKVQDVWNYEVGELYSPIENSISRNSSPIFSSESTRYIVNTSACKIPDLNPWADDLKQLTKKCEAADETDPKCEDRQWHKNWMYAQGSTLFANHTAIRESGYSTSLIRCCYRIIERVEQSLENYDMDADSVVRYSQDCYNIPLAFASPIYAEFIRVTCISISSPLFLDVVYREFFAFVQPDTHALDKISKWLSISNSSLPPNIVLLGLDTNSRLNSHRRLPLTLKALQDMGAVEFFGYTKNSENTFPNTAVFLAGISETDLRSTCQNNTRQSLDGCPFLWKEFDRAGYLTSTSEDAPLASSFNYLRTGFVQKPTDFYYRPFTLAILKQPRDTNWFGKCVGQYSAVEVLLKYLQDMVGGNFVAPFFIHTWLDIYSHSCINTIRFVDPEIARFVQSLKARNTILFFMSDHGDRYGPFRDTNLGWYEDKLPSLWIYLPSAVRTRFPEWKKSLEINARRLTSHYDLYHTLVDILQSWSTDTNFHVNLPRKIIGQSLMKEVAENRTCETVGVPSSYCACSEPVLLDVNSKDPAMQQVLKEASITAIAYLNNYLPEQCARLTLRTLVSGKVMRRQGGDDVYVLTLLLDPGEFLFEVTLKTKSKESVFFVESLSDILRLNKMARKVTCVNDPTMERYCYCFVVGQKSMWDQKAPSTRLKDDWHT